MFAYKIKLLYYYTYQHRKSALSKESCLKLLASLPVLIGPEAWTSTLVANAFSAFCTFLGIPCSSKAFPAIWVNLYMRKTYKIGTHSWDSSGTHSRPDEVWTSYVLLFNIFYFSDLLYWFRPFAIVLCWLGDDWLLHHILIWDHCGCISWSCKCLRNCACTWSKWHS